MMELQLRSMKAGAFANASSTRWIPIDTSSDSTAVSGCDKGIPHDTIGDFLGLHVETSSRIEARQHSSVASTGFVPGTR